MHARIHPLTMSEDSSPVVIAEVPVELPAELADVPDMPAGSADLPAKPAPPKYGHTEDGNYDTPYLTTFICAPGRIPDTYIPMLCDRAQIVDLSETSDPMTVAEACPYLSPYVVVFDTCEHKFGAEALAKFYERGFQRVSVCLVDAGPAHIEVPLSFWFGKGEQGKSQGANPQHVVYFPLKDIYDHVVLAQSSASAYLMEMVLMHTLPEYKSSIQQTREDVRDFFIEIRSSRAAIAKIVESFRGLEMIEKVIAARKQITQSLDLICANALWGAPLVDIGEGDKPLRALFLGTDFECIASTAPAHPRVVKTECDYIMSALLRVVAPLPVGPSDSKDAVAPVLPTRYAWDVTLYTVGKNTPSAHITLLRYGNALGNHAMAYIRVHTGNSLMKFVEGRAEQTDIVRKIRPDATSDAPSQSIVQTGSPRAGLTQQIDINADTNESRNVLLTGDESVDASTQQPAQDE